MESTEMATVKHRLDGWHVGKGKLGVLILAKEVTHIHTFLTGLMQYFRVQEKRLMPLQKRTIVRLLKSGRRALLITYFGVQHPQMMTLTSRKQNGYP